MTTGTLLGLFAETPLHPGAGQAADVVDLPVAREGATGLPQIPDTGLKGAMRQWAESTGGYSDEEVKSLFGGAENGAGNLMIASARLLCLPVRRLDGAYAWVTTPYLLERLRRDSRRCLGAAFDLPVPDPQDGEPPELLVAEGKEDQTVYLEEFSFTTKTLPDAGKVQAAVGRFIADEEVRRRITSQLAVMSAAEFATYAANALPVNARNHLDENKMSDNLWYEETLPPDSLFYAVILPRNDAAQPDHDGFIKKLHDAGYLRIGGNETVGQGWMAVCPVKGGGDDA